MKLATDPTIADYILCDSCGTKIFDNMMKEAIFVNVFQRPERKSVYCTRICMLDDNRKSRE